MNNSLKLRIDGLGHVPSFKNNKMIVPIKRFNTTTRKMTVRPTLIANPKRQKWMQAAIQSLVSQLQSECQTTAGETSTETFPQSLTAWCSQFDDSRQWIDRLQVNVEVVEKGKEGADILLYPFVPSNPVL